MPTIDGLRWDFINTVGSSYIVAGFDTAHVITPGFESDYATIPDVHIMSVDVKTESFLWSVDSSVSSTGPSGITPTSYVSPNSVGSKSYIENDSSY